LRLYKMMCAGQISLHDAQVAISTDWEAAYRQYVGDPFTVATAAAVRVAARHHRKHKRVKH